MTVKPSFFDHLSSEGRLRYQFTQAIMDPNLGTSLDSLRQILRQLQENPAKYIYLWLPFLDVFLHESRVLMLTPADLIAVIELGTILANTQLQGGQITSEEIWWRVIHACDLRG